MKNTSKGARPQRTQKTRDEARPARGAAAAKGSKGKARVAEGRTERWQKHDVRADNRAGGNVRGAAGKGRAAAGDARKGRTQSRPEQDAHSKGPKARFYPTRNDKPARSVRTSR